MAPLGSDSCHTGLVENVWLACVSVGEYVGKPVNVAGVSGFAASCPSVVNWPKPDCPAMIVWLAVLSRVLAKVLGETTAYLRRKHSR